MGAAKRVKFRVKLTAEGPGGAWVFLKLPIDVQKTWGTRARLPVRGTINGAEFRSSVFPDGKGTHQMMVNKGMQGAARAEAGDEVKMEMEPDTEERTVKAPGDLRQAIAKSAAARKLFEGLSYSCRKEFVEWITGAKREETRKARIGKAVEMLERGKKRVK